MKLQFSHLHNVCIHFFKCLTLVSKYDTLKKKSAGKIMRMLCSIPFLHIGKVFHSMKLRCGIFIVGWIAEIPRQSLSNLQQSIFNLKSESYCRSTRE